MKELPKRWQNWLKRRGGLTAYDFGDYSVQIRFEDGSFALFHGAFAVQTKDDVIVFTEHCGYHLFARRTVEHVCQFADAELGPAAGGESK